MAYTKDIGLNDFYKEYKSHSLRKGKEHVDYKTFRDIVKYANELTLNKIVYENQTYTLPGRLGELGIRKFETTRNLDNKANWKIDYEALKKTGKIVYFESKYGYRWKWNKKTCHVRGRRWYKFKPCRLASRSIADAIKNKNMDYYTG